jgi:type I restriction enzyme, S subunit
MTLLTPTSKWQTFPLCEIADIERNAISPDGIITDTKYVGLEDINRFGHVERFTKVATGDLASTKFQFTAQHILYGKLRPYLSKIALPDFNGICSTDILPILVTSRMDRRFLYYFLRQPHVVELATRRSIGANLPRLSPKRLAEFEIPLPFADDPIRSLSEQTRIADILDKADAIRRKRKDITTSTRELMMSIFDKTFGQPLANPHDWPVKQLSEVVADGTSVSYGIVQCGPEVADGVPYIRTSNMTNEVLGPLESFSRTAKEIAAKFSRSTVRTGDLVFANRASIGAIVELPAYLDGANLTQGTTRIAPGREVHRHYLMWLFRTAQMQQWLDRAAKGVTFREVTMGRLREAPVPLPPFDLQEEFSNRYQQAMRMAAKWDVATFEADDLFNSLVQRAFKGEL